MTTAQDIVTKGLELSKKLAVGQTPSNKLNTRALTSLNDMIASWKSDGLDLQLSTLTATDTVYLDASDILALKYMLGVTLANESGLPISNYVSNRADDLYRALSDKYLAAELEEMEYPDGLIIAHAANIESGC